MSDKTIPFSVLDLAPIPQHSSAREAFTHSLDLAKLAEKRGYHRYWLAEHHNMTGIASAATSVLIGYPGGEYANPASGFRRRYAPKSFTTGDRRAIRHAEYTLSPAVLILDWVAHR